MTASVQWPFVTTAWWGFCPQCRCYFGTHVLGCTNFVTFSFHRAECRCVSCQPGFHAACADTLVCERTGHGKA